MKKFIYKLIFFLIFVAIVFIIIYINKPNSSYPTNKVENKEETQSQIQKRSGVSNLVSGNGNLHVSNTNLQNMYNENFQLKGLSSHGIQWFSDVITYDNLQYLRDNWGINVFRVAMYTNENGYISHPQKIKETAYNIIDMCVELDLYVIIDWHILSDSDPNIYKEQAKAFFNETSLKYKDVPNVIYEICNEPNQSYVTWENHIKPYANEIIPIIRNNSQNSLILVGTPDWSKDLISVVKSPLNFDNIMYTLHFYAASHKTELQNTITTALSNNIPVFISEWGTTDASGNSELDLNSSINWINFMDTHNLSWVNWSFCNKDEASAILAKEYVTPNQINDSITKNGSFIKKYISTKKYNPLYEE